MLWQNLLVIHHDRFLRGRLDDHYCTTTTNCTTDLTEPESASYDDVLTITVLSGLMVFMIVTAVLCAYLEHQYAPPNGGIQASDGLTVASVDDNDNSKTCTEQQPENHEGVVSVPVVTPKIEIRRLQSACSSLAVPGEER